MAIKILKDTGLFEDILSEALKGTEFEGKMSPLNMSQNNPWHQLSLWDHTMQVVTNVLEQYPESNPEKRLLMVLSSLMHDLGKLCTHIQQQREYVHDGVTKTKTTYHGHEDESSKIATYILRYLKFENDMISKVSGMVAHHMDPHVLEEANSKSLRRFIRKIGEDSLDWLDVFQHATADAYAKSPKPEQEVIDRYNKIKAELEKALSTMKPIQNKIVPVLNGNEIMTLLDTKPGQWMKEITEYIKELMDEDPNISKERASDLVKKTFYNKVPHKTNQIRPI